MARMIPVRVDLENGNTIWRGLPNLEHATLCRAFSLDECSVWFDVPQSVLNNPHGMPGRRMDGMIFRGPKASAEPIGKFIIAREGERFRDIDPDDKSEFYNMSRASLRA